MDARIDLLDTGQARVAEVDAATDQVVVHEWLKKSILMFFSLRGMEIGRSALLVVPGPQSALDLSTHAFERGGGEV